MKVWTRVEYRWNGQEYEVDEARSEWHEYEGPVSECKKGDAPSPDPAIGKAALENIQLGKDWLAFAKNQFEIGNERQKAVDSLTGRVVEQQMATQDKSNQRADEQWERFTKLFQPVEDRMVSEAMSYDSPEKQAEAAATARADIMAGAASAQRQQQRQAAAMGISPTSGRFEGIDRATTLATELAGTGAANKARIDTRNMGIMLRKDAAGFGRGLTGTAAQSYGIGLNAGNSASGNQLGAEGNFRANQAVMSQGFNGAIGANTSAANTLNSLYSNQLSKYNAEQQASAAGLQAVGSIGGAAIGAFM